jgi:aspartate racemase
MNIEKKRKYDIGIIGGMGPAATAETFNRIVMKSDAKLEQNHPSICIIANSHIPDRTAYIIDNNNPSPIKDIQTAIDQLVQLNVRLLIMPCNSAHFFLPDLQISKEVKFINMIEETKKELKKKYPGQKSIVLATKGTIKGKLYENEDIMIPLPEEQTEIMHIIYQIKANADREVINNKMSDLLNRISKRSGINIFILGCTELSLYRDDLRKSYSCIDCIDALINAAIKSVKKNIKS